MKNKKTIFSIITVIILGIGLYFFKSETLYSAADVLRDVDFNAEAPSLELKKIDVEAEEMFVPIELTDKTQQELIKAFEKSKFKKDNSVLISNDYRMKITLNRGYVMYLDMNKKGISVENTSDTSYKKYLFKDGKEFFSILKKAVTE